MSLFIETKNKSIIEWHLGEPVPKNLGRVVKIQADGDELDLILFAMKSPSNVKDLLQGN